MKLLKCTSCKLDKPQTVGYFTKTKITKSGVTQPCKDCHKKRMKIFNNKNYKNNTAKELIRRYKGFDNKKGLDFDLDEIWFIENIMNKPCCYCNTEDDQRGADRLDNTIGHIKTNVVPCCRICNVVKNNIFTLDEMKKLGKVISEIRIIRVQAARL